MQNIMEFENHPVRMWQDDKGELVIVAKDVAEALGYSESAISQVTNLFQSVPSEWKGLKPIKTLRRGQQGVLTLTEQGLYFFLGRSDKPAALPFQKWLAGEVLPSIRKTGGYGAPAQAVPGVSREELEKLIADKVVDAVFRYRHVLADSVEGVKALEATRPVPPAEPTEREILEQCIREYVAVIGAAHDVATARDEHKPIVNPNMARGNVLLNITHFSEWFGAHKAASRLRIFTTQALSGALRRMHCRKVNLAYLRPDGGKSSFSLYVTNIHN